MTTHLRRKKNDEKTVFYKICLVQKIPKQFVKQVNSEHMLVNDRIKTVPKDCQGLQF